LTDVSASDALLDQLC